MLEKKPGRMFPGDEIIFWNGIAPDFRQLGEVVRAIADNEENRRLNDPTKKHWKRTGHEFVGGFLQRCLEADVQTACKEYSCL